MTEQKVLNTNPGLDALLDRPLLETFLRRRTHRVSRGAFQAALEQFGRQGVVELALIFGNYSLLAVLINTFDTDLPPDRTERLLPI